MHYFSHLIRFCLAVCLVFNSNTTIIAQELPKFLGQDKFSSKNIRNYISDMNADSIKNAGNLSQSCRMTANYIASTFKKNGLLPVPKSDFIQKFSLRQSHWADIWLEINNKRKVFLKDFYALGHFNIAQTQEQETVLLGFAIDDERYSDYRAVDVTNRAAIIFMGEPVDIAGNSLISGSKTPSEWADNWQRKVATARDFGAKTCFVVPFRTDKEFYAHMATIQAQLEKPSYSLDVAPAQKDGIFFIPPSMAAEMMAISVQEILRIYEPAKVENPNSNKRQKREIGIPARINEVRFRAERLSKIISSQNVIGYLEGSNKKEEYVLFGCNYNFYDPCSITDVAALLEMSGLMAQASKNGNKPNRSILFAAFMDTENNRLGSRYYVSNPVVALEKTVASLHLGQIDKPDSIAGKPSKPAPIYVSVAESLSDQIKKIAEKTIIETSHDIDTKFMDENSNIIPYQSGYYNFVAKNIPSVVWFGGSELSKSKIVKQEIDIERIIQIASFCLQTGWQIVVLPGKLEIKPIKPPEKQDKF